LPAGRALPILRAPNAGVAQLVEQSLRKREVGGSSPSTGTRFLSWNAIASLTVASLPLLASAAPTLIAPHTPVELLRQAEIRSVTLAPGGRQFAFASRKPASRTDAIVVMPTDPTDDAGITRSFQIDAAGEAARVDSLRWVGDRYLVADVTGDFKVRRQLVITGGRSHVHTLHRGRLFSLNVTDGSVVALDARLEFDDIVDDSMAGSGVLIAAAREEGRFNLYRVNLDSGEMALHAEGGPYTSWRAIDGKPVLRMDYVPYRELMNVFVPEQGDGKSWKLVNSHDVGLSLWLHRHYVAEGPRPTDVYILARRGDADTDGIHLFDVSTHEIVSTLAEVPGRDIDSGLVVRDRFVAASYVDDHVRQDFFDPVLHDHYTRLEQVVGPENSVEVLELDEDHSRWLVRVSGPRLPPEYHLYDVARRHLQRLISERPWLDPERLAPMAVLRVKTREGVDIDAFLTCQEAQDRSRAPLLAMPPAGPWTRSSQRFSPVAQAFASQGWCVLEPNYRGVHGYGQEQQRSAYGKWSRQVSDDILDAVRNVLAAGIGDRDRIAFYAENLGAYATLIGAIENPGFFRAGVTVTAVVDLETLVNQHRTVHERNAQIVEDWMEYQGKELRRNSPLMRADALACPVLLIHERGVSAVPISQSEAMLKALQKAKRPVRSFWLPDDETWSVDASNELLSVEQAIAFLQSQW
jgi:dipeptidyl aminopeptidase/acylaminoacyl peptidase